MLTGGGKNVATKIALCVGQNNYDPSTGVTPLRGCVNDTLLIGEMLRRNRINVGGIFCATRKFRYQNLLPLSHKGEC